MSADFSRTPLLRRAVRLEWALIVWNVAEGAIAVAAGLLASSVALFSFGVDSIIEVTSASVVLWRLLKELDRRSPQRVEERERTAAKIAGILLLALAVYIVVDAARRLIGYGREAEESVIGVVLTSASLVAMPVLGWAKLRTAERLGSAALRADSYETITCAWLSLATLVGLSLNAAFGWAWADPVAALVIVPLVVREGLEALRGDCCGRGDAHCGP
ncbi:MAG: cation transporter [Rhodopirellula sp.]|nr:cation transporter [Rhodopirellula sp.]